MLRAKVLQNSARLRAKTEETSPFAVSWGSIRRPPCPWLAAPRATLPPLQSPPEPQSGPRSQHIARKGGRGPGWRVWGGARAASGRRGPTGHLLGIREEPGQPFGGGSPRSWVFAESKIFGFYEHLCRSSTWRDVPLPPPARPGPAPPVPPHWDRRAGARHGTAAPAASYGALRPFSSACCI